MKDIPLKAKVSCTDGLVGNSTAVVINPINNRITHLVVARTAYSDHMVPIEHVVKSDHESIELDLSKRDLAKFPSFKELQYVGSVPYDPAFQDYPSYQGSHGGAWQSPYVTMDYGMDYGPRAVEVERIPRGELPVHRGDKVEANDGKVGIIGEFVIDNDDGHVSHLVLLKGHLWGKREVAVPVDLIDKKEGDVVYLKVDKEAINDLPSVKIKRHYRANI